MASLIESLADIMDKENIEYEKFLELSNDKTASIVNGDVEQLQIILGKEQRLIEKIDKIEAERKSIVADICSVLRLPAEEINVEQIVRILEKKPKEHDLLQEAHLKLKRTIDSLVKINENNKVLLRESMDMIEFELNLARNTLLAPTTATYSKNAYEQHSARGVGGFDAKQ